MCEIFGHFLQLYQNICSELTQPHLQQGVSFGVPFSGDSLYYQRHFTGYGKGLPNCSSRLVQMLVLTEELSGVGGFGPIRNGEIV